MNNKMYAVFINNKGNLQIEEFKEYGFENDYYIYYNESYELCEKYCYYVRDIFHNYTEFYEYLHIWCEQHKIDFCGCASKYIDEITKELNSKEIKAE